MIRDIAIEKTALLILAILLLLIGIMIIYRLYNVGVFNIEQTNKTINDTLKRIT